MSAVDVRLCLGAWSTPAGKSRSKFKTVIIERTNYISDCEKMDGNNIQYGKKTSLYLLITLEWGWSGCVGPTSQTRYRRWITTPHTRLMLHLRVFSNLIKSLNCRRNKEHNNNSLSSTVSKNISPKWSSKHVSSSASSSSRVENSYFCFHWKQDCPNCFLHGSRWTPSQHIVHEVELSSSCPLVFVSHSGGCTELGFNWQWMAALTGPAIKVPLLKSLLLLNSITSHKTLLPYMLEVVFSNKLSYSLPCGEPHKSLYKHYFELL